MKVQMILVMVLGLALSTTAAHGIPPVSGPTLVCVTGTLPRQEVPLQDCNLGDRMRLTFPVDESLWDKVVHVVIYDEDGGVFARVLRPIYIPVGAPERKRVSLYVFGHWEGLHLAPPKSLTMRFQVNEGATGDSVGGEVSTIDFN